MSLKEYRNGAKNFWGLVEQKGPWKTTKLDVMRSKRTGGITIGGGIPGGGTDHAGHGGWFQSTDPKNNYSVIPPPPKPSRYAQPSIRTRQGYAGKPVAGRIHSNTPYNVERRFGEKPRPVARAGGGTTSNFQGGDLGFDEVPDTQNNNPYEAELMSESSMDLSEGERRVYEDAQEFNNAFYSTVDPEHFAMAASQINDENVRGNEYLALPLKEQIKNEKEIEAGTEALAESEYLKLGHQHSDLSPGEKNFLHLEDKVRK